VLELQLHGSARILQILSHEQVLLVLQESLQTHDRQYHHYGYCQVRYQYCLIWTLLSHYVYIDVGMPTEYQVTQAIQSILCCAYITTIVISSLRFLIVEYNVSKVHHTKFDSAKPAIHPNFSSYQTCPTNGLSQKAESSLNGHLSQRDKASQSVD
jgi:hypothetical protein